MINTQRIGKRGFPIWWTMFFMGVIVLMAVIAVPQFSAYRQRSYSPSITSAEKYTLASPQQLLLSESPHFPRMPDFNTEEIFKNLLTLRAPVLGARNEYATCLHLAAKGVPAPTVAAFGERGRNPARRQSFVICDALEGFESLEDVTEAWETAPPDPLVKRRLVMAVAGFARAMHGAGVVHRDFYICHLLLNRRAFAEGKVELAVIDLHRAQVHGVIPRRWLRRDLAALLFSVLDLPFSRSAWLRFVRVYRDRPLQQVFGREGSFWRGVYRRALALYRKGLDKGLVQGRFRS